MLTVFVGASSSRKPVHHRPVARPRPCWTEHGPELLVGGVAIPERHSAAGTSTGACWPSRTGASFFVTQVVYDVERAKSMVSDYYYACAEQRPEPAPVVFTLSVCGSTKSWLPAVARASMCPGG